MDASPSHVDTIEAVSGLCATARSVAAVLPAFADVVLAAADCDLISVILYDADREFVTHAGSFPGVLDAWTDRRPGAMYGTQIMQGYPEGLEYVTAGNQSEGVLSLARNGIGRAWTVPLIVAGETYGTMTAGRRGIEPFEAGVLETLRACGHVLARGAREEALVATAAYDQARSQLLELLAGAPGESALDDLLRDALPALGAAIPFDALVAVALDETGRPATLAAEPPGALHEAVAWDALESAGPAAQAPVERAVAEMRGPFAAMLAAGGISRVATAPLGMGAHAGVLAIGRRTRWGFSQAEMELLTLVSGLLGTVVANRARAHQARLDAARNAALGELAVLVTAGKPIETLFAVALPLLERALQFDYISLLAEADDGELRRVASQPEYVSTTGQAVSFADSQIGDILASGSAFVQYLTHEVRGASPGRLAAHGIQRMLSAVLMQDGEPLGVLGLGRRSSERFGAADVAFVEVLATLLGQAVGSRKKVRTLERDARRSQILSDLALLLNNREPVDRFFFALQERLPLALQFDQLALSIVTDDGAHLRRLGAKGDSLGRGEEMDLPKSALPLFEGETVRQFTVRPGHDPEQAWMASQGMVRVVTVVLRDGPVPLGIMNIGRATERVYTRDELDFAGLLGTLLSQSLAWRRKDLLEEQQRDGLEQTARLTALGELVSGIAHELNNPLTSVIGFADLLADDLAGTPQGADLEVIRKEALRARDIVRDLLFIARPGTGERSVIDLADVVAHVERLRGRAWQQQGIDVRILAPAVPLQVVGNEQQLTQVLLNLVLNAEDAMTGVVRQRLRIALGEDDGRAVLSVRDNGHGMSEETARRVFEPFYSTKRGRGNGLGLSISYGIAAAHGGELTVRTEMGRGTTFAMLLPPAEGAPVALRVMPPPRARDTHARVLVVDDEPSIRALSLRLLAQLGHEGVAAGSVGEAVAAVEEDASFDLVVCDYRLGADRADTFIATLRSRWPALLAHVVIATGATTEIAVQELVEREGLALLAKPYGGAQLRELLAGRLESGAA
ncbi:MAG: GAF domain-containing protein [Thermoflexaceae bacterium]|nr:GAF domain-containing protein [Thermoflexaceae bacterium]